MNLDSPITDLPKVGPILTNKFKKLGINTVNDLFYHVPSHYLDYSLITTVNKIHLGDTVTIHAKIVSITNIISKKGIRMQIGSVEDSTGKLMVVWFNQPFLTRILYPGKLVSLSGKIGFFNKKLCLSSPDYEILETGNEETVHTGRLVPVYPETAGLSSKWLRRTVLTAYVLPTIDFKDFLPKEILTKEKLVSLKEAVDKIHFPKNEKEVEVGKKRLAFNEMLFLQLKSLRKKINWQKNKTLFKLKIEDSIVKKFINSIPFKLTESQNKSVREILSNMQNEVPMNRLLQGDVGSGKTVVAAIGAFAAFTNGYQTMIMAPTQILAEQHYKTIKNLFSPFNIRISLLTSDVKIQALGQSDVFIGTHSLIHSKVNFEKVALVVIDEQHRFGVEQRSILTKKSGIPHVLTMTATPIPRTIALTTYGDLELSVLNEMPTGRQKITTWAVPDVKRDGAYDWIKKQVKDNKSQAFIVCPLIQDSDKETMKDIKSVTTEFSNLKSQFSNLTLGLLHGRMKPTEKNEILEKFRKGKIDILVSTPVVEVGIDIPNATIMVIEAAERFGLAQLHQLRGRVGRGDKKSYCLLFANVHSGNAFRRLKAMEKMHSGFELAELDLDLRGPGDIFGTNQSGFAELKIASWSDFELIKKTRDLAEIIIKKPKEFPKLIAKINLTITN
ncbi:MAG TPA: ATP-dependent DNA helicase RecG [Patescibacteria group bacterium]|nr:ATP-dependent DNA helicase RecG [Patescibacteria group bacterium]